MISPQKGLKRINRENYVRFRKSVLTSKARRLKALEAEALERRVDILNVGIDNFSWHTFLKQLEHGTVFTPNVDHLMTLREDSEFQAAYAQADYRVCDSQILFYASRLLGKPIKAKISGADLLPNFCDYHRDNAKVRIFLLGGAEGVPQKAQRNINARIGRDIVVAAHSPSFGFEKDEAECAQILTMIKSSTANVLVVGVGAPKQEKWIAQYRSQLPNIKIFMALGAAIDFEAGNKPRAPKLISSLGLEWLYRLLSEPRRLWQRYLLRDMPFLWLLLKETLATQQKLLIQAIHRKLDRRRESPNSLL